MAIKFNILRTILAICFAMLQSGCIMTMMNRSAKTIETKNSHGLGTSVGVIKSEEVQFIQIEYFKKYSLSERIEYGYQLGLGTFFIGGQLYGKYQLPSVPFPIALDLATGIYGSGQDPSILEDELNENPFISSTSSSILVDIGNTTTGPKLQWNNWIDGKKSYFWPAFFIRHSFGNNVLISPELTILFEKTGLGFQTGVGIEW